MCMRVIKAASLNRVLESREIAFEWMRTKSPKAQ